MMEEHEQEPKEVVIGFVNEKPSPTTVEFADGPKQLPDSLIARLGGQTELEKLDDGLRQVTYEEFIEGLSAVESGRYLNRIHAQVISDHFGPRFF